MTAVPNDLFSVSEPVSSLRAGASLDSSRPSEVILAGIVSGSRGPV